MPSQSLINKSFSKARNACLKSTFKRQHIGAVLVYGGKVIAEGYNTQKTLPLQKLYNRERFQEEDSPNNGTCHAEMMILQKTKYLDIDWSKALLFVYREHKITHQPMLAKPCAACEKALADRGIHKIYYTTNQYPYNFMNLRKGNENG